MQWIEGLAQVSISKVRSGQATEGDARPPTIRVDTFKMGLDIFYCESQSSDRIPSSVRKC